MEVLFVQRLIFGTCTECAVNIFRKEVGNGQIWRIRSLDEKCLEPSESMYITHGGVQQG
jgi:hypothetical protein